MLDIISRIDTKAKIHYVFFDTGLEYDATKRHLDYLERKYNITIERVKAIKSIPLSIKQYGIPFKSKFLSEMIQRAQQHNFKWENGKLKTLNEKYPGMKSVLKWWTNDYETKTSDSVSRFNINYCRALKDFLMINPPEFKVSNKCCDYAKKKVARKYEQENNIDLSLTGIRAAEKGIRAQAYKNCFSDNSSKDNKPDTYRPIFYFTDEDKAQYKELYDLKYSDCYEVWGMDRTGCVGCPYGRKVEEELALIKKYEPNKYKACMNLFGQSYEYHNLFKKVQKATRGKSEEETQTIIKEIVGAIKHETGAKGVLDDNIQ